MVLADLVAKEADVALEQVMLLRHSNENVKQLLARGGSVDDYTCVQPTGSRYDYTDPSKERIAVVAVIVDDAVYGVYRVLGVKNEGTTYNLTSEAHMRFDVERGKRERPAKRFMMEPVQSAALGLKISGWEGRSRTTVQRSDGSFFGIISVELPTEPTDEALLVDDFNQKVRKSLADGAEQRSERLARAPKLPRRAAVTSVAFLRNPDVVAEVLIRANGYCELCSSPAPFRRRSDGTPYLEVHHKVRLADRGEDTVANAIAICPNCHRREHYA